MQKRFAIIVGLSCFILTGIAQEAEKKVVWTHGLNFKVRPAGVDSFDKAKQFGAEGFHDKDLNKMVFVLETGTLDLGSAAKLPVAGKAPGDPLFSHALELKAREAGQEEFEKAPQFGMEVYKDVNTDNLLYITEAGSVAVMPAGSIAVPTKIADPEWFHGLEMKVRKAGESDFDKAQKVSLEVYKDANTNQLVYVTSKGQIAIASASGVNKPEEVKGPTWHHAFEIKVRKADEEEFGKDTRMFGVEVYKDENADKLVFVCETGSIAVVSASGISKPEASKAPEWLYGRSFRVRTFDMTDFNDKTPKFGAEVYKDVNTGLFVYMTDNGSLRVLPGK